MYNKVLKALISACLYAIAAPSFSASAEEYKSLIRYDRIWEHIYIHWDDMKVFHVRFDGAEDINGKTYHRLVAFRKAAYDYDESTHKPYLKDIDDNYYEHEGFLREEDGKVYTLVARYSQDGISDWTELYIPDGNESHPADLEEKLIYDFTCKEGDTFRGLQSHRYEAIDVDYKVTSVENVEIDGENHRILRIVPDDERSYDLGWPIVEGIGIASYGCLTTVNFLSVPSCPCMNHVFNRVLSSDGQVLYRTTEGCVDIPINDFLGVQSISDQTDSAHAFDILGRRISTPAPGQPYIKGGKKHIAQ